jgi:ABC-type uncharacterized transport system ATPase subunit
MVASLALAGPRPSKQPVEVDPVALATKLVAERRWQQAAGVLAEVEKVTRADQVQFHTLRGMVALNLRQYQVSFDRRQYTARQVIAQLLEKFEVEDLELHEPELSDIVRAIYEGEFQV